MRGAVTALAALALAGCATSSLVLLPDEGGGNGAIRVRPASGGAVVMNQANSRASLGSTRPTVRPLGAKGLKANELALLNSLPPPARSGSPSPWWWSTAATARAPRCRSPAR